MPVFQASSKGRTIQSAPHPDTGDAQLQTGIATRVGRAASHVPPALQMRSVAFTEDKFERAHCNCFTLLENNIACVAFAENIKCVQNVLRFLKINIAQDEADPGSGNKLTTFLNVVS